MRAGPERLLPHPARGLGPGRDPGGGARRTPPDTDALELLRAVSAPLYYRFAVTREELTPADAERAVAAALAAAAAGAFATRAGAGPATD